MSDRLAAGEDAATNAISYSDYAGWAFKAVSVGVAIYGAIQSGKRHKQIMETLKNYHQEEMKALGQIMNQLLLDDKEGLMETYVNNINNVFKDLVDLNVDAGGVTPAENRQQGLNSVQKDGTRCALDNLRNYYDKIAFDAENPAGSLLELYHKTVSEDGKTQSERHTVESFWNDSMNILKRGQCNLVARYMMEIDKRNQKDTSDEDWAAKTDKPEITDDQIQKLINSEWDGELEDGYSDKFEQAYEKLRDAGFAYIADKTEDKFACQAAMEPDPTTILDHSGYLNWDKDEGKYGTGSFSIWVLEGMAQAPEGCAVVGLELVQGQTTTDTAGAISFKLKGLSLRIHYKEIDKILSGDDGDPETLTITENEEANSAVQPTGYFNMSFEETHHVNTGFVGKKITESFDDDDCLVIVGAGLRKVGGDSLTEIGRLDLALKLRKFDLNTKELTGPVEDGDSKNTNFHDYLSGAESDGSFAEDEMNEKFSKIPSIPDTCSMLHGTAIKRHGSTSYLALYSRYFPDIPEQPSD